MGETSTTTLKAITNIADVKGLDTIESLNADETVFYYALRTELDRLQKQPKTQTVDRILKYSKSLR
ncbi:hypothetical protein GCM10027037_19410 [Mucilaginibacter koreensis]